MEEQFVTYPIALKMKEMGFIEECFGIYYYDGSFNEYILEHKDTEGYSVCIPAPIWQQAIDWLREKKHLHVKFMIEDSDVFINKTWDFGIFNIDWGGDKEVRYLIRASNYKTFEDAREASILKALEIIANKN